MEDQEKRQEIIREVKPIIEAEERLRVMKEIETYGWYGRLRV